MASSPSSGSVSGTAAEAGGGSGGGRRGQYCTLARPDGPKDTSEEDALAKTYRPSLKTFEEEIMEAMGIVETRRAKKSYWY